MAEEILAPAPIPETEKCKVFLSGMVSAEASKDWRWQVVRELADESVVFLNPRREDWDSLGEESADNPPFVEQVSWEIAGIERADFVAIHFSDDKGCTITLLELGLCARVPGKAIVYCPKGFWRKGNVDVVCKRYGIRQVDSVDELIEALREAIHRRG